MCWVMGQEEDRDDMKDGEEEKDNNDDGYVLFTQTNRRDHIFRIYHGPEATLIEFNYCNPIPNDVLTRG